MNGRALDHLTSLLAGGDESTTPASSEIALRVCEAAGSAGVPLAWVVLSLRRSLVDHPDQARIMDLVQSRARAMVVLLSTWPPVGETQLTLFFGNLARLCPRWSDMHDQRGLLDLTNWWMSWTRAWRHLDGAGLVPAPFLRPVLRAYRRLGVPAPEVFLASVVSALGQCPPGEDPLRAWIDGQLEDGTDLSVLMSALGAPEGLWDDVLGLDTAMTIRRGELQLLHRVPEGLGRGVARDGLHYEPVPWRTLARAAVALRPWHKEVIVDLGAGAGRILCLLEREQVHRAWGIEVDEGLVARATANTAALERVEIVHADLGAPVLDPDARLALAAGTTFFLYNPFGARTLGRVVQTLEGTLHSRRRRIRLVYLTRPVEAWLLDQVPWLRARGEVTPGAWVWDNTRAAQASTSTRSQDAEPSPSASA